MKEVSLTTRTQWRNWLARNHDKETGIWLVFYKKHTGKPTLAYDDVVEEALCFGWIDSIIKKLDEDRYARKLTPRKPNSAWSAANKKRVKKLLRQKLFTDAGLAVIQQAKKLGRWSESGHPQVSTELPAEFRAGLAKNKKAQAFFAGLAKSYQKHFIVWIAVAKRPTTRERRVNEAITLLEQGKKLGMK